MCAEESTSSGMGRRSVLLGGLAASAVAVQGLGSSPASAAPAARKPFSDTGTELVLLGTAAGPPPEPDRAGIASVLRVDGKNYLVDCGRSAVTNYFNVGLGFGELNSIFITHLHADHIADYYNVFMLPGWGGGPEDRITQRVEVYGPGPAGALQPAFHGRPVSTIDPADPTPGLADMTQRLIDAYAYSTNVFMRDSGIPDPRSLMEIHEIQVPDVGADPLLKTAPPMQPFAVMEDDRVKVTAILVPHGPVFPAFAFRFDTESGSVVFSGDTSLSDNVVRLAQGADVLVHEAVDLDALGQLPPVVADHIRDSHTSVTDVGGVAERAGVGTLVLSHLFPAAHSDVSPSRWRRLAQQGFGGRVIAGEDLMRIPVKRHAHARR